MKQLKPLAAHNSTPWVTPFATRFAHVKNAARAGKKTVVYFYEYPDGGTFRYRVYNLLQALEQEGEWTGSYFFEHEIEETLDLVPYITLPVMVRLPWSVELVDLTVRLRAAGKKIVVDYDDLMADVALAPEILQTLNVTSEATHWFSLIARNQEFARHADVFTATNDFLGAKMQAKFEKPFFSLSNIMNSEQLEISAKLREEKAAKTRTDTFDIGYFSGSKTHENDFLCAAPEIAAFMHRHEDVRLQVVGYMKLPKSFDDFAKQGRVLRHGMVNFLELQRLMAQVDMSIAPLVDNEFTSCKSELKYFEAAAVLTPVVASPSYVFERAIKHGETGFLCRPGQWGAALEEVYAGGEKIQKITAGALAHCLEVYSPQGYAKTATQQYNAIVNL